MKSVAQTKKAVLDTAPLFRMPWTNSDNAFSWLEITRRCDLNCGYCYQSNTPGSDKSMERIESDLRALLRLRKTDTLFVSGGEPLLHPQLMQVIRMVRTFKVKPVLVTNGQRLTPAMCGALKDAGLLGVVCHVDSGQSRPGWDGRSEEELNALRQQYADMACDQGLVVGFNTTILPETLHEVPAIVRWTIRNIHKVSTNTLIPVRVPREDDPWELYVGGERIDLKDTAFSTRRYKNPSGVNLTADDIYAQIKKVLPKFAANAFLGGTEVPHSPKWMFSNIIGTEKQIFGNMGPKAMEILQNGHHLFMGRFLSFLPAPLYGRAKLLLPLGLFDRELRSAMRSFLRAALINPLHLFRKISVQSLLVLQPQDVLPSGRQDLCDGCPNKMIYNGRLVSMCRVEEFMRFGDMVSLQPKQDTAEISDATGCTCTAGGAKPETMEVVA
jgi:hypothetical protein